MRHGRILRKNKFIRFDESSGHIFRVVSTTCSACIEYSSPDCSFGSVIDHFYVLINLVARFPLGD